MHIVLQALFVLYAVSATIMLVSAVACYLSPTCRRWLLIGDPSASQRSELVPVRVNRRPSGRR